MLTYHWLISHLLKHIKAITHSLSSRTASLIKCPADYPTRSLIIDIHHSIMNGIVIAEVVADVRGGDLSFAHFPCGCATLRHRDRPLARADLAHASTALVIIDGSRHQIRARRVRWWRRGDRWSHWRGRTCRGAWAHANLRAGASSG